MVVAQNFHHFRTLVTDDFLKEKSSITLCNKNEMLKKAAHHTNNVEVVVTYTTE
jgi:hypothetical protein